MNEEHQRKIQDKTRYMPEGHPVTITCRGRKVEGVVIRANNYFDYETLEDDWYIEFRSKSNRSRDNHPDGGYGYWKQGIDGGTCEFPITKKILETLDGHEILSLHFEGCVMVKDGKVIQMGEVIAEIDDEIAKILLDEAMIDEFGEGYRASIDKEFGA